MIDSASGYIVFPDIRQGGLGVGAAGGEGIAYQNGRAIGYAELRQLAVGALAGGQRYAELIVVRDPQTFERIKSGHFDMGAQASAVVLKTGAATATQFDRSGLAVFVESKRGAMVNASLTGQTIHIKQ
jgi:hypothetical protein